MIQLRRALAIGALILSASEVARAQVPWETPQMLSPHAPRGVGIMAASFAAAPGDGSGVMAAWRRAEAPTGYGFRVVAGVGREGRTAIGGGLDVSTWVARASDAFPVDVIWLSGFGGSYGDCLQLALPMGFAAGRSLWGRSVWFNPYVASRAVIEGRLGGSEADEHLELQFANEIGANISFDTERRFILRMAAAIGDRSAFAVGLHVGGGRSTTLTAGVTQ